MLGLERENRAARAVLLSVIGPGLILLLFVSIPLPELEPGRLLFWLSITIAAAALPVRLPNDLRADLTTAPIIATLFDTTLTHPFALLWVAFLGTIEMRELRGQVPWYGVLFNRFNFVLSAFAGWLVFRATEPFAGEPIGAVLQLALVGTAFIFVNNALAIVVISARTATPVRRVLSMSVSSISVGLISQVPLGWLMALIAIEVGYWATLLFAIPLLLARFSFSRYTETRELFYGSVSALSQAIDAKDGFTRGHADRVSRIAGALARQMRLPEKEIELIELAGMLHDIGKIGVEDRILLKPARLDPDERELMKRHTVYGASILEPSAALRPLIPVVLHHHESYDGSGYPESLSGEAIPLGARILIVADAYEAMTSDRVYRRAIGHDKAVEQLQKYKGIQFDSSVVRAFDQLLEKQGASAFEVSDLPPINYETLEQVRRRLAEPAHGAGSTSADQ